MIGIATPVRARSAISTIKKERRIFDRVQEVRIDLLFRSSLRSDAVGAADNLRVRFTALRRMFMDWDDLKHIPEFFAIKMWQKMRSPDWLWAAAESTAKIR